MKKAFVSFVTIFNLVVGIPFTQVYAQEAVSTDTPSETVSDVSQDTDAVLPPTDTLVTPPGDETETAPAASDEEQQTTAKPDKNTSESQQMSSLSGEEEPENIDQRDSTLDKRLPKTDEVTGALVYNYPIDLPSGRNGMTPELSLRYNSQDKGVSIFGRGWSDSIPFIERINKKGTDTIYTEEYFNSSLDGELVKVSSGNYRAKVENGAFNAYVFDNNSWTITDKNGKRYFFGVSTSTRQDNINNENEVLKWMLEKTIDANGNSISYSYYKDAGQIYPDTISYTNQPNGNGIYSVNFSREQEPFHPIYYRSKFSIRNNYRINKITINVNGNWSKEYSLSYATSTIGTRSLVQSITEKARDEAGNVIILPATQFAYEASGSKSFTQDSSWQFPSSFAFIDAQNWHETGSRIADINGDGLPDLVSSIKYDTYPCGYVSYNHFYINTGSTWEEDTNWSMPQQGINQCSSAYTWTFAGGDQHSTGLQTGDLNGDGLADLFMINYHEYNGSYEKRVWLNKGDGTGWAEDTNWNLPNAAFMEPDWHYNSDGAELADINGDNLPDIIKAKNTNGSYSRGTYLNTGSGFVESTSTYQIPSDFYFIDGQNKHDGDGARIADINGDGLPDLISSKMSTDACGGTYPLVSRNDFYINTGTGWEEDTNWVMPYQGTNECGDYTWTNVRTDSHDTGLRFGDLNGDGLADLFMIDYHEYNGSYEKRVWLNKGDGTGWTDDIANWNLPNAAFMEPSWHHNEDGAELVDVNGDSLPDIIKARDLNGSYTTGVYINNEKEELITAITVPEGGTVTAEYKYTPQYTESGNLLNPKLPFSLATVSSVTNGDGFGNYGTTSYAYSDGSYYFSNALERKFAGFGKIVKTDPAGNVTKTYYHQGNDTNSSLGEYDDDISKANKPYRIEQYDNSDNLYGATVNKWDKYAITASSTFVKLVRTTKEDYDGNSSHKDKTEEYSYNDSTGDLTQKITWGEVAASDDGSFTDTGTDKATYTYSYAASSTNSVVSFPSRELVQDQSSNTVRDTKWYYDDLSFGSTSKGNRTKEEKLRSGSSYIQTQKTYNSFGNITSDVDARGATTTYAYDAYSLLVASTTNPLGQTKSFLYDYSSGKVATTTDENGLVFATKYDALDRPLEEKQPDFTAPGILVTKTAYTYTDTPLSVNVRTLEYLDGTNAKETYAYKDGLGRVVQTREREGEDNTYAVKDIGYNNRGLVSKESLPYFNTDLGQITDQDNFNSYSNGTLQGEGGWATTDPSVFQVQDSGVYEGATASDTAFVLVPEVPSTDVKEGLKATWDKIISCDDSTETVAYQYETDEIPDVLPGEDLNLRTETSQTRTSGFSKDGLPLGKITENGKTYIRKESVFYPGQKFILKGEKTDKNAWRIVTTATTTEDTWEKNTISQGMIAQTSGASVFNPGAVLDTVYHYYTYGTREWNSQAFGHPVTYISDLGDRFVNVSIPKGSTITAAKVTYTSSSNQSSTNVNTKLYGEASDDPAIFVHDTTAPFPDFENRVNTTANVTWSGIDSWTLNSAYDSPDISSIIQEIVNRAGWVSGNHLVIFLRDNGSTANAVRSVYGYYNGSGYPYLTVTYAEPMIGLSAPDELFTRYTYDPLGRVLTTANSVGTTTNQYNGRRLTVTDPLGNKKEYWKDAYGNLTNVVEYSDSPATTTYAWDLNGKLTRITDAANNIRNFSYDNLGRLLVSEDLHASGDSTYGSTTRQYDDAGNVTQVFTPSGDTITYLYDVLNRVTSENAASTAFSDITNTYDNCQYGVGRLCQTAANNTVTSTYAYNPIGLVSTEAKKISTSWATTTTSYFRNGAVDTLTYPDTHKVSYVYNSAGQLNQVLGLAPATTTWSTIIESITYGPNGQPTAIDYGNNTKTIYEYDAAHLYRLTRKYTVSTSTNPTVPEHFKLLSFATGTDELPLLPDFESSTPKSLIPSFDDGTATDSPITLLEIPTESDNTTTTEAQTDVSAETSFPAIASASAEVKEDLSSEDSAKEDTASSTSLFVIESTSTPEESDDVAKEDSAVTHIAEKIKDLSASERANLKGRAIAKLEQIAKTKKGDYSIEIVSMEPIEGGVQVFARAWDKNGDQIGFGKDGTVDMERFRIFNPPILVEDPDGDIVQEWDEKELDGSTIRKNRHLREDPKEALLQSLSHTISVMKNVHGSENIDPGKRGNTTDTYYSAAGGDGIVEYSLSTSWSTTYNASTGRYAFSTEANYRYLTWNDWGNPQYNTRAFFPFDTSALGDSDTISSATLSLYQTANYSTSALRPNVVVVQSTQTSPTALGVGDYSKRGSTNWSSEVDLGTGSGNNNTYVSFSLNSAGLAGISKTGYTQLAVITTYDRDQTPINTNQRGLLWYFNLADQAGVSTDPKLVVEHSAPSAPAAPTNLLTNGLTNPLNVSTSSPSFSAIHVNASSTAQAAYYQIQIATFSEYWGAPVWDSGKYALSPQTPAGSRTANLYSTTTFALNGLTYYWRIKLWDQMNNEGPWSTSTASFTMRQPSTVLQDLRYTYDAVGNITNIVDASGTNGAGTYDYQYDALYRLTRASSTNAVLANWLETYAYDSLGNITNKSNVGSYTYAGTNYANPHAVTSIGGTNYAYDQAGNLTQAGNTSYAWDYANRISGINNNGTTTAYWYDQAGQRVEQDVKIGAGATSTTKYWNKYYETSGATTTLYLYLPNGELLGTIEGNGTATSTFIAHTDHLGGTNVLSDKDGNLAQLTNYYPYGSVRQNEKTAGFNEQRKYIGQFYDDATALSYLNARYYNGVNGQFLSEDPMFTGDPNAQNLLNPQSLNSYGYAGDNPIRYSDPSGKAFFLIPILYCLAVEYGAAALDTAVFAYFAYEASKDTVQTMSDPHAKPSDKVAAFSNFAYVALTKSEGPTRIREGNVAVEGKWFRGGDKFNLENRLNKDYTIDSKTGYVTRDAGPSVNVDPNNKFVENYGGAYKVLSIPKELEITGGKNGHGQIVPKQGVNLTVSQFQGLLNKVQTEPYVTSQSTPAVIKRDKTQ